MKHNINLTPLLDVILILIFAFIIRLDMLESDKVSDLTGLLNRQKAETQALENQLDEIRQERAALRRTVVHEREEKETLSGENDRKKQEFARTADTLRSERDALTNQLEELKKLLADMEADLAANRNELAAKEKALADMSAAAAGEKASLNDRVTDLTKTIAGLQEQLSAKEKELVAMQRDLAEVRKNLEDRDKLIADNQRAHDADIEALRKERSALIAQVEAAARDLTAKERALLVEQKKALDAKTEADRRAGDLADDLRRIQSEKEAVSQRLAAAVADRDDLTRRLADERKRLDSAQAELDRRTAAMEAEASKLRGVRDASAGHLAEMAEQVRHMTQTLTENQNVLEEKQKRLDAETQRLAALEKDLASAKASRDELIARMEDAARKAERKSRELSQQVDEWRQQYDRLAKQAETLQAETTRLAAVTKEKDRLTSERDALSSNVQDLRRELDEKEKLISRLTLQSTLSASDIRKGLLVENGGKEPRVFLQINFEYNKDVLNMQGKLQSDQLGMALTDPSFNGRTFMLIGHTDERGTDEFNQDLSVRRANEVKNYLVEHFKIDPARIVTMGRGEREPLVQNAATEYEHALNRRVEVRVSSGNS